MGAWGFSAFENDDAMDWALELEKVSDLSRIETAFSSVEQADDHLDALAANEGFAACEVLARLLGQSPAENADAPWLDEWISKHPVKPSPSLRVRAIAVIDRILGDGCELRDLFVDDASVAEWQDSVNELRRRLAH